MERAVSGRKENSRVGAIIAAAGTSQRMAGVDKLFAMLAGRPLLVWTLEAFQLCQAVHDIVLVVHELNLERARNIFAKQHWPKVVQLCKGGPRRQDSVAWGLEKLSGCDWVVVHDGARPCVTPQLIELGLAEAQRTGSAVAAVPVTDTIKTVGPDGVVAETPLRSNLWAVQTPQIFRFDIIQAVYANAQEEVTDDASLVEKMGYPVKVFRGDYDNIKVTNPQDLAMAEWILERRQHGD